MIEKILSHIKENVFFDQPFAILYRPHITGPDKIEILFGSLKHPQSLSFIDLADSLNPHLLLIPYRQLIERNFSCIDDKTKLIAIEVEKYEVMLLSDFLNLIPQIELNHINGKFDMDDDSYMQVVKNIIDHEIGKGEGSNFVIKRTFHADILQYTLQSGLSMFRHLLENEKGAHWIFYVYTGENVLIGASPELHVNLNKNSVLMNPISGTYRYPSSGPTLEGLLQFIKNLKEADELYMVVEEELKMIARFCPQGGKIVGPFLKEMSCLAHTEYFIEGETSCGPIEILRETLFAPTVTGSPIENACRVISKYESTGRGYYAGVSAFISRDEKNYFNMDSAILIRTADINNTGHMKLSVGATIVRHSQPAAEARETYAKAKALLNTMQSRR